MTEISPKAFEAERIPRPCADCNGTMHVLGTPAPNGARLVVIHAKTCPAYSALRDAQAGAL